MTLTPFFSVFASLQNLGDINEMKDNLSWDLSGVTEY